MSLIFPVKDHSKKSLRSYSFQIVYASTNPRDVCTSYDTLVSLKIVHIFQDLKKGILKILLGRTLDEEQVRDLIEHLSFESMKHNQQVNRESQS